MLLPPTTERTLAEMWDASMKRNPPIGADPADLENARICFMQGALATLWLIAHQAGKPAEIDAVLKAIGALHRETMEFLQQRSSVQH